MYISELDTHPPLCVITQRTGSVFDLGAGRLKALLNSSQALFCNRIGKTKAPFPNTNNLKVAKKHKL